MRKIFAHLPEDGHPKVGGYMASSGLDKMTPTALRCPYCGGHLVAWLEAKGLVRVVEVYESDWLHLADLIPETHVLTGCETCRANFTHPLELLVSAAA